jgi:hypothetical protein
MRAARNRGRPIVCAQVLGEERVNATREWAIWEVCARPIGRIEFAVPVVSILR